jgi:uncharacterized C2H2 Zn-finger protein
MKRIKIQSDDQDVCVECPHCGQWEQLGIDDPRKRLNTVPILEWYPDIEGQNEVSLHKCVVCDSKFETEWDYDNP